MSGPDRIITIINSIPQPWQRMIVALMDERDKAKADLQNPTVLAALPEVQALIAQLRDRAEKAEVEADFFKSEIKLRNKILDLGCVQTLIAGAYEAAATLADAKHEASMKWASVYLKDFDGDTDSKRIANEIRALIPADAIAARDAMIAEAVDMVRAQAFVEGREAGMLAERQACAAIADGAALEIADKLTPTSAVNALRNIAAAIRKRGDV